MIEEGTQGGLLEREHQLTVIERKVGEALAGSGCVVVVEGAAGVGKSSLMRALASDARDREALVLSATGGELEREFPFGLVRQLLEPVVMGADAKRRSKLLSGAAAAAGPILGASPDGGSASVDGSFSILHGLYWLVASLADEQPLVLCLDDVHWADSASLRFADFLARRVGEHQILLALGLRPNEPGVEKALIDSIVSGGDAEMIEPRPLSRQAVADLVSSRFDEELDLDAIAAAHSSTGGNPLLLRELIRGLESVDDRTAEAIRDVVPASVKRSVERRLEKLSEEARTTARHLAVLGDGPRGVEVLMLAKGMDREAVLNGIDALRANDLLQGDPPSFTHPLIRQAIAETVPSAERMRLHGDAAKAMRDTPGMRDELLVHLLAAPPVGEDWAISALGEGGRRALAEGAPEAAVSRLRRALDEAGTSHPEHSRLSLDLGIAQLQLRDPVATSTLLTVVEDPDTDIAVRASGLLLGLGFEAWEGDQEVLVQQSLELLESVRDTRTDLYDELTGHLLSTLSLRHSTDAARRELLASQGDDAGSRALSHLAFSRACDKAPRDEVLDLVRRSLDAAPIVDVSQIEQPAGFWALEGAMSVDDPELAREIVESSERVARSAGSRLGRAFVDFMQLEWNIQFGSAVRAEAAGRQAYFYFQDFMTEQVRVSITGAISNALILQGRLDDADAQFADMPSEEELDEWYMGLIVRTTRGELSLAQGRPKEAIADLRRAQEHLARYRWSTFGRGYLEANLSRALLAAGERDEAVEVARAEVESAQRHKIPVREAAAMVTLAHAEDKAKASLEMFEAAAEIGRSANTPWVKAHVLTEFGSALRRSNRREAARPVLREAAEIADSVDAKGIRARATDELVIAGGKPRREIASGVESLTPAELRAAEHAADGMSNREIAEALFVTVKTIELHLGRCYSKLDIKSRAQLGTALATTETA